MTPMINEGGCSHMMLVEDRKLHGLLFGVALQPAAAIPKLLCTYLFKGLCWKEQLAVAI